MARIVDPAASFERASRHIFRHLHDVAELRRNPLAMHLLDQTEHTGAVIGAVTRLAETCRHEPVVGKPRFNANREYTVFVRAVIGREPWGNVASDLGLSRRQFTRDKAAMCQRISSRLSAEARAFASARATVATIDAEARITSAYVQAESGDLRGALAQLDDIMRSAPQWSVRFEAHCTRVRILSDYATPIGARSALSEARRFSRTCDECEGSLTATARARLDIIEASLARQVSTTRRSLERLERADDALRCVTGTTILQEQKDRLRLLIERGILLYLKKGKDAAKATLTLAVERLPDAQSDMVMQSDALIFLGITLGACKATHAAGTGILRRARELASAAGLRSRALIASVFLTQHEALSGDASIARTRARECIGVAESIGTSALVAMTCMNAADLSLLSQQTAAAAREAESLLARAGRVVELHSEMWASIQYLRASASLLRGETEQALRRAHAADAAALGFENSRMRASTLRLLADIHSRRGELSQANHLIHEAVDLSERYGSWGTMAACLRVAAKITGKKQFTRRAIELDSSLVG